MHFDFHNKYKADSTTTDNNSLSGKSDQAHPTLVGKSEFWVCSYHQQFIFALWWSTGQIFL